MNVIKCCSSYTKNHVGRKEVTSRRSPSVSQNGSTVILFNRE
ncbi:MAG: hypothetical protein OJF50_006666 [Nitrospira sp.]|nr:hypothetical protein [Nitrospira sp.]